MVSAAENVGSLQENVIAAVMEDENVDAAIVFMGAINWIPGKDIASLFRGIKSDFPDKTMLMVNPLGDRKIYLHMNEGFQSLGMPNYASGEDAVAARREEPRARSHDRAGSRSDLRPRREGPPPSRRKRHRRHRRSGRRGSHDRIHYLITQQTDITP